jgi:hypothetical protein
MIQGDVLLLLILLVLALAAIVMVARTDWRQDPLEWWPPLMDGR